MTKIPCTIGMLTYNSETNLARALESVKDFNEIIIADGGSTDSTLSIAERYGAKIIPQSNPGHPITDFALERNRTIEAATSPWFFYLDSDEIMSPELRNAIETVTADSPFDAYRVRYLKTSEDGRTPYRTFKEYYQVRLFRTGKETFFIKPVHERIHLPEEAKVGVIEAPWLVPMDADELSVRGFSKKAWERTKVTASEWQPRGLFDSWYHIVSYPFVQGIKAFIRMLLVRFKWGTDAIPARYELLRMRYSLMLSIRHAERLITVLRKRLGRG